MCLWLKNGGGDARAERTVFTGAMTAFLDMLSTTPAVMLVSRLGKATTVLLLQTTSLFRDLSQCNSPKKAASNKSIKTALSFKG